MEVSVRNSAESYWTKTGDDIYNNNTGNVGIGTDTPDAKLEVTEDILVNGITVGMGGGSMWKNTAFGLEALKNNVWDDPVGGINNTAIGIYTLWVNEDGCGNTGIGAASLQSVISGSCNTAVGTGSLNSTTSSFNTAVGFAALTIDSDGNNTAIGYNAGAVVSGSSNVFLGAGSGGNLSQKTDAVNSTAVGAGSYTDADNQIVLGDTNITEVKTSGMVNCNRVKLLPQSAPTSEEGAIYFDTSDKHFYGYNGTTWKQLDN